MIPLGGIAVHKNFFKLLWKRFSEFLNITHKYNSFQDISHLFYKNVINDIDEDISAVVLVVAKEIFFSQIILFTEFSASLALASNFLWTVNPDVRLGTSLGLILIFFFHFQNVIRLKKIHFKVCQSMSIWPISQVHLPQFFISYFKNDCNNELISAMFIRS